MNSWKWPRARPPFGLTLCAHSNTSMHRAGSPSLRSELSSTCHSPRTGPVCTSAGASCVSCSVESSFLGCRRRTIDPHGVSTIQEMAAQTWRRVTQQPISPQLASWVRCGAGSAARHNIGLSVSSTHLQVLRRQCGAAQHSLHGLSGVQALDARQEHLRGWPRVSLGRHAPLLPCSRRRTPRSSRCLAPRLRAKRPRSDGVDRLAPCAGFPANQNMRRTQSTARTRCLTRQPRQPAQGPHVA